MVKTEETVEPPLWLPLPSVVALPALSHGALNKQHQPTMGSLPENSSWLDLCLLFFTSLSSGGAEQADALQRGPQEGTPPWVLPKL